MSRDEAFEMFNKYTWDDSDITKKEITRYQGKSISMCTKNEPFFSATVTNFQGFVS